MDLTKGSHRGENVTIANDDDDEEDDQNQEINQQDYLLQAENIIKSADDATKADDNANHGSTVQTIKHNLEKYNQAVELLNASIQSE